MGTVYSTMGTIGYYRAAGYYGYCTVPTNTAVVPMGTSYGTIGIRVLYSTQNRVLQAYAAEEMSRLRLIGLGLGFAHKPARYLTFL